MFDFFQGKKTYVAGVITAGFALANVLGYGIPTYVYAFCAVAFGTSLRAGVAKAERASDRK